LEIIPFENLKAESILCEGGNDGESSPKEVIGWGRNFKPPLRIKCMNKISFSSIIIFLKENVIHECP
jgi:hypothetical protein